MPFGEDMFGVTEIRGGGGIREGEQAGTKGLLGSGGAGITAPVIQWEEPRPPTATACMLTNWPCVLHSPTQEFLGEGLIARVYSVHPQANLRNGGGGSGLYGYCDRKWTPLPTNTNQWGNPLE